MIVGVENVVDEEEYNQFDEYPLGDGIAHEEQPPTGAACYLRVDHQEGLIVKDVCCYSRQQCNM